jgi:hypothetical protein
MMERQNDDAPLCPKAPTLNPTAIPTILPFKNGAFIPIFATDFEKAM